MARVNKPISFSVDPTEESYIRFLQTEICIHLSAKGLALSRILNTLIRLAVTDPEVSFKLYRDLADQIECHTSSTDLGYEEEIRT